MDMQNIKTFLCIAKLQNFSKAAEELNYAQSTVTAQIKQLEKELGFPLFERIGRKNYLTPGGKEFLLYATDIIHLFQKAGTIGAELENTSGVIRIGILESLLFAKLLPHLNRFQEMFPKLEIIIKIGQTHELVPMLKQNLLDIIYISSAANADTALRTCYSRREELVFVASEKHNLTRKNTCLVEDIFKYPFITTEPTGYCFSRLREISSEYSVHLKHSITVDSISAIISLLADNKSVAFIPEYALDTQNEKNVTKLITNLPSQYYFSQILCSGEKWISPFIKAFIEYVSEIFPER